MKLIKMQVKYRNFAFFIKFLEIVLFSSSYDSITSSHIIVELSVILANYFPAILFLQLHVSRIPNIIFFA